jgi:hypothetical protein
MRAAIILTVTATFLMNAAFLEAANDKVCVNYATACNTFDCEYNGPATCTPDPNTPYLTVSWNTLKVSGFGLGECEPSKGKDCTTKNWDCVTHKHDLIDEDDCTEENLKCTDTSQVGSGCK